MIDFFD